MQDVAGIWAMRWTCASGADQSSIDAADQAVVTGQGKTGQGRAGQGRAGQGRARKCMTGQGKEV